MTNFTYSTILSTHLNKKVVEFDRVLLKLNNSRLVAILIDLDTGER